MGFDIVGCSGCSGECHRARFLDSCFSMSLHLLDSFTFIKYHTPYSFHNSHFVSDTNNDIGLFREIGQDKMGIYKGIYHPFHLCFSTHSLPELGIRRPPKDIITE